MITAIVTYSLPAVARAHYADLLSPAELARELVATSGY